MFYFSWDAIRLKLLTFLLWLLRRQTVRPSKQNSDCPTDSPDNYANLTVKKSLRSCSKLKFNFNLVTYYK
jgi:hypothetical protein